MLLQMTLFLSFYGQVVFHCVHVPHLLYPPVSGHLSCFHVLATVNSAAMNISISRSVMSDSLIPWTVAHQALLSMELFRQES